VLAGVVLPRDALEDVVRSVTLLDVIESVEHCRSQSTMHDRRVIPSRAPVITIVPFQ
jgi:hypothetical protein